MIFVTNFLCDFCLLEEFSFLFLEKTVLLVGKLIEKCMNFFI